MKTFAVDGIYWKRQSSARTVTSDDAKRFGEISGSDTQDISTVIAMC